MAHRSPDLRTWRVAGAVVEHAGALLLVRNRRRGGRADWSTPGGVIDAGDATVLDGLAREVREETGLVVTRWEGPLYRVEAHAPDLGWALWCEVHRALHWTGRLRAEDPDGIVDAACFSAPPERDLLLSACAPWVREPLLDWLGARWDPAGARHYRYEVRGEHPDRLVVRARHPPAVTVGHHQAPGEGTGPAAPGARA